MCLPCINSILRHHIFCLNYVKNELYASQVVQISIFKHKFIRMSHIFNKLAIVILSFFLLSGGCDEKKSTKTTETKEPVTELNTKFEFSDYENSWKQVDSLDKQGLPKSALEIVNVIMEKAAKEKNQPMMIKSLMYQLKFNQELEENEFTLALNRIDELRKTNIEPLRQILASIKAQMLWLYLQNNRYKFYNRSTTQDFELGDVSTWDIKTFVDESGKLFFKSLENKELLQQILLEDYSYILTESGEDAYLTAPTVFDFLAHQALSHFQNDETEITRPAAKFAINDKRYFSTDSDFTAIPTESEDSLSHYLHYVKIMQDVVRFHSNSSHITARLRNELNRISFAYGKSTLSDKTELYKEALLRIQKNYSVYPIVGEVNAYLAQLYVDLGNKADASQSDYHLLKTAHQLCVETINKYPKTYGANRCEIIRQNIEYKSLNGNIEKYNPSGQHILIQHSFKNLDSVHLVIYQLKTDEENTYYYELKERLKGLKLVSSKQIALPKSDDFHEHTTEFAIEPLPLGHYLVLLSTDPTDLEEKKALHWTSEFQVTDLAYSLRDLGNSISGLQVSNRQTGTGISAATVNVYEQKYNYTTRKYVKKLLKTHKTNTNGWVEVPHLDDRYGKIIEIVNGKDVLSSSAGLYTYKEYTTEEHSDNLFTDRSIYRPGQTVYFKGIRLVTKGKTSKIVADDDVEAILMDVNYQEIADLELTTNEYGSFSGSFRLPTTGLTGQMHIETDYGTVYFSVEEYKRPTFKVELAKSTSEYKLGETIKVEGNTVAYAGNAVDNATVKYVVKRSIYLPYWRAYYLRIAPVSTSETIISEGTVQTDEKGKFTFDFKAEKDPTRNYDGLNYNYKIEVDVTDLNGETRSSSKSISVGESSLQLTVSIPQSLDKTSKNSLSVNTSNSEGQPISATGTVVVSLLKPNNSVTRNRNWETPDKPFLSDNEFKKLFPYIDYQPTDKMARIVEKEVEKISFNTEKSTAVAINSVNWKTGDYKIETTTKDKNGVEVKDIQFVTVTDAKGTESPFEAVFHAYSLQSVYEPGETITIPVSSSLKNQFVLAEINVDGTIVETKHLLVNNEQKTISFKVEEKHRGGISIHLSTVKYGKQYTKDFYFTVPYSNKELQVSFETFRNKLLPGEQEEWRLRITGPKKEKVAAELLITMYDASLDAFKGHNYSFNPFRQNSSASYRSFTGFGNAYGRQYNQYDDEWISAGSISAPELNWFGYYPSSDGYHYVNFNGQIRMMSADGMPRILATKGAAKREAAPAPTMSLNYDSSASMEEVMIMQFDEKEEKSTDSEGNSGSSSSDAPVPLRSNFNETAFFLPQLKTDANGDILVTFTVPESLTSWKVMGLAHTKELEYALVQNEVVTQKELMVQTNVPRFIRNGDRVVLTAKVSNLTEKMFDKGIATIQLFDALTMQDVTDKFILNVPWGDDTQSLFSVDAKQSTVVSWYIAEIPENINSLVIRVTAKAANHTDGEELTVPVLTDKVLVTESMPMTNNGKGAKDFVFNKLVNSKGSSTLTHHSVTLEYTSNPAWYVVQALPYMLEYPYDCSEQIFTRFYANSIASNIVRSSPKIKEVFEQWKNSSPDAFLSNLEKNQQLKSVILEETPWVLDAKDESERKKRIALLFDFNKMDNELAKNLNQLKEAQVSNGGFPWFPGMRESQYVTQYIVSGMGHLNQLGIVSVKENKDVKQMIQKAVKYLDARMLEEYNDLKKRKALTNDYFISQYQIQYMYARSFFTDIKLSSNEEEAFKFFKENAEKHWLKLNLNNQTMFALSSHRNGNTALAEKIMNSVIERSITTEEMGMYWKENERGYYWYQAPIETQSLIIEALHTIKKDQKAINNAKIWLLRNKQASDWKTTTATANACYALLIGASASSASNSTNSASDWITSAHQVKIEINGKEIKPEDFGSQAEAGTGYFQATWTGKEISSDLGKVKVTRNDEGFSWGAMYWQYFESMDKVTSAETNLKLKKQLFVVRQTSSGEVIVPVKDGDKLKRGEKVRVRIELSTDRNMEFVHMKDFRAAGFEPVNVLSRYKWQGGLGYYENTRDVATHFFFDYLPKGNYVFEYDLRVSHSGDFSNGFATIQCMYAPEFTSHSNGVRVKVE
jgi:hypothetical protein